MKWITISVLEEVEGAGKLEGAVSYGPTRGATPLTGVGAGVYGEGSRREAPDREGLSPPGMEFLAGGIPERGGVSCTPSPKSLWGNTTRFEDRRWGRVRAAESKRVELYSTLREDGPKPYGAKSLLQVDLNEEGTSLIQYCGDLRGSLVTKGEAIQGEFR